MSDVLVKSRDRVVDFGEVFTPQWLVEDMLNTIPVTDVASRWLEPACGSGNFLAPILERKLQAVCATHSPTDSEFLPNILFAVMNVYGIELQDDNVQECRDRLFNIVTRLTDDYGDTLFTDAVRNVLRWNIIQGDAQSMCNTAGDGLRFSEWEHVSPGVFQRREFRFDTSVFDEDIVETIIRSDDVTMITRFARQQVDHPEKRVLAYFAVYNPACPEEVKVEWVLLNDMGRPLG